VFIGSLEGSATLASALDAEDSAVLRWWLDAPRTRPVRLLLDEANRAIAVYGAPVPLATMVGEHERPSVAAAPHFAPEAAAPHVAPDLAQSAEAMELSEPPPAVRPFEAAPAVRPFEAELAVRSFETEPAVRPFEAELAVRPFEAELAAAEEALSEPILAGEMANAVLAELAAESMSPPAVDPTPSEDLLVDESPVDAASETPETPPVFVEEPKTLLDEPPVTPVVHGPLHPSAASDWQQWARELEGTRGPKPLAAVERLFVMSYVPLRDAYLRGLAPREVGAVLESFATGFATSYREAFAALCVRGKRPTMVLDVADAAHRIGRLHGARSVQLLLVDGLRFDLGLRVELGLRARLGREVALTERLLLWSALPSTTETQLELIGRGPDGLRELPRLSESEVPVARGRMARTPRRIKAGHRELLKLDLVEARLSEPGVEEASRLDTLGVEVADAVAELCEKLPQRTLLCVFGDHGFRLDPQGEGTSALKQGGARPEEVLVPAFAWLVGGVQ
jgi:hypothetical protein